MIQTIFGLVLIAISSHALSQNSFTPTHQQTSQIGNARFEIIQSQLAAKWTFRLDRYTGKVWQLVKTKDDDNAWESMSVAGLPPLANATKPRFQIFTSGLAARHTFLLDSETGTTWVIVVGKRKRPDGAELEFTYWEPFSQ